LQYATSTTDSHPNGLATELVSPQFVQEIFNAAIFYEGIIPVELTSFTISTNGPDVILRWSTATELNNFGFEIERKVGSGQSSVGNFEKIGFVNGQGTTTQKNEYSFADKNMVEGNYFYRLKQIDFGGNFEYSQIVEINWSSYTSYKLEQNYPNPFNPSTKIEFSIPVDGFVNLAVYNLLGEKVTQLLNSNFKAGAYEFIFDASSLSSGVYFYKIESGTFLKFKKMILSK